MKKLFYLVAIGAALFASACSNDDENGEKTSPDTPAGPDTPPSVEDIPIVGDFLLTGQCSDNPVRYETWVEGDQIGVFVSSDEGLPQNNLLYTPKEVGAYDSEKFELVDIGNVELVADGQKAGFKQGKHTIYAYYPYVAEAVDVKAVPMPDITVQDLSGEHPVMYAETKYVFGYAKATCSKYSVAAVDFGMFTSPVTKLNLNNVGFEDESLVGKTVEKLIISGDKYPIGYKEPTFDLTEEKFGGEAAPVEVLSNQKVINEMWGMTMPPSLADPFTIVLAIDLEKALEQTYTLTAVTTDGVTVKAEGVAAQEDWGGGAIMIMGPALK